MSLEAFEGDRAVFQLSIGETGCPVAKGNHKFFRIVGSWFAERQMEMAGNYQVATCSEVRGCIGAEQSLADRISPLGVEIFSPLSPHPFGYGAGDPWWYDMGKPLGDS